MKTLLKIALFGLASTAFVSAAGAADIIEEAPLVPVEIGSGWYLRGDVSYDFETDLDVDYKRYYQTGGDEDDHGVHHPIFGHGKAGYDDAEIGDAINGGLGFGYQFTDYFRGDLTAHYWKADLDIGDDGFKTYDCEGYGPNPFDYSCRTKGDGDVEVWELMANAYVDLITVGGFTPYVGGGLGAVHVDYDDIKVERRCYEGADTCSEAFDDTLSGEGDWRFAYALMAGVSYDLTNALKLDVGYRYVDVDGGDMFGKGKSGLATDGGDDGFDRHTIQAGVRYSLF